MQNYKSGSHTRFDIKYHLVWITKYRKPVTTSQVEERFRELIRQICQANDVVIIIRSCFKRPYSLASFLSPCVLVSRLVQNLKGSTSYKLFQEFAHLKQKYWGQHLLVRGYFVATTGTVTYGS